MFSIGVKQEQYATYILQDHQVQSRLEVVPERGGIITNWRIQGQNILYMDTERFTHPAMSVRGGVPLLFPICGNLPDNTYSYNSNSYNLKQHGFARDLPWEVVKQETKDLAKITLALNSSKNTYSVYPFDFQLLYTYELQAHGLKIGQRYTNNSDVAMPFSTGIHPYFWVKDKQQISLEIPSYQYQDQKTKEFHPYDGMLDWEQEELDLAFTNLSSNSTSFTDRQRRLKVTITYSDIYSTLVFWTLKGKDYICLEPWSAPRNALNTGENLLYVQPHSSVESSIEFQATSV